ncbi:hypothetical protein RDWZM_000678 [Blomia tropicalis]|uniref:Mitochondrial ribosomal protein S17 n=1 Tax=Blomia tropicalis TaxID=40697 RepID=A0A9Q0MBE0_BLOTA|nr:37S ribosomal protein S17 mitochondrial [Blomia tropicalis]KAJ6222133.1 hypothetical protein RDWZM_000678 [Blomia tropicalis]
MSLLLAKCITPAKKNVIRLLVPQLRFDTFLSKHFRENDSIVAHDPNNNCKEGDWVLLRKLDSRFSLEIDYQVEKIVYESGNIIDPITKKKSLGYENVEDVNRLAKFFEMKPNLER